MEFRGLTAEGSKGDLTVSLEVAESATAVSDTSAEVVAGTDRPRLSVAIMRLHCTKGEFTRRDVKGSAVRRRSPGGCVFQDPSVR